MTPQTTFAGGINPFATPPRIVRMVRIKPVPPPRIEKIKAAPKPPVVKVARPKPAPKPPRVKKPKAGPKGRPTPGQDSIYSYIAKNAGATTAEIRSSLGLKEENCLRQIRKLLRKGVVERGQYMDGKRHWFTYQVVEGAVAAPPSGEVLEIVYSIKLTESQRETVANMGGGRWLREQIEKAAYDPQAK